MYVMYIDVRSTAADPEQRFGVRFSMFFEADLRSNEVPGLSKEWKLNLNDGLFLSNK